MYGNGCTDGELCIRFPSEDLRKPIMRDNALDQAIVKEDVNKNQLAKWFEAACRAGQRAHQMESQPQSEEAPVEAEEPTIVPGIEPVELITESIEPPASEAFEGDDEQSVADQDVEMQDS